MQQGNIRIRLLVQEDHSGCSVEVGLEWSKTGDRNCWKTQMREDSVLVFWIRILAEGIEPSG